MDTVSAVDAKTHFGALLDTAQANPVQISKHGRPVAYVLSSAEYERLQMLEELTWETAAAKVEAEGEFLSAADSDKFLQDILNGA
jgi:prevent-host-death family protein